MVLILTLATFAVFAASRVLAGMDAAFTSAGRLPQQHEDLGTDSLTLLTDTDAAINILQTIARRSTADMRMLTDVMKQRRLDDERRLQEEVERLKAEQPVLRQRWLRAERALRENKRKAAAASQASLQHVQALESDIIATLQEVEHLRGLQHNLEQQLLQANARCQASWWQRFSARWRACLAWLVRSCNSLTWFTSRQGRTETHPTHDAPEETGREEDDGLASDAEPSLLQDVVTADDETGEVITTDGVVSSEGEANEEVAIVERPETVGGDAEEVPGATDSFVTSQGEGKDSTQEGDSLGVSGKTASDEAATLSYTTPGSVPPSQADNSGAAPRSQEVRRRRWMVYSFAVLSYAFLALRIYVRFRRRQDGRRLKFH